MSAALVAGQNAVATSWWIVNAVSLTANINWM
jgi:hypothetical protein